MRDSHNEKQLLVYAKRVNAKLRDLLYLLEDNRSSLSPTETDLYQNATRTKSALDHIIRTDAERFEQ